ncbi:MAG: DEAD/DEAH box helicase [Trueperaceae bacterium]|nr:MAG: DEAD/DEAH box helicase [Trueperaceae bacterium]
MTFEDFALHERVAAGIRAAGYTTPTPIQQQAIPAVMAGRDVLGLAMTGTGKTAAFALPILQRLMNGPRNRTRALIVAPTRELAEQIHDAFKTLGQATNVRSATIYGGVGMNPQIQALRRGTEVIVACPGRLLDLMQQGHGDFRHLEVLVLDEADHMFDMGFLPDIRRLLRALPSERQSLLFSATMPSDVRHLVDETLTNPLTVEVERPVVANTVDHRLYPVPMHLKIDLLEALLKRWDARRVLVFTRTKHRAKRLAEQLDRRGFFTANIQGNLSQNKRQQALEGFKRGDFHVLVATDIAARGIDISMVSHVVNFDVPDTEDAYTHRIGRTGRAEHEGDAVTFVTREDADMIRRIERRLAAPIPREQLEGFAYDAPPPRQLDADQRRFERGSSPNTGGPGGRGQGASRGGSRGGGQAGGRRDRPSAPSAGGNRRRRSGPSVNRG